MTSVRRLFVKAAVGACALAGLASSGAYAASPEGMKLYQFSSYYLDIAKSALSSAVSGDEKIMVPVGFYLIRHPKGDILFDTGNNDKLLTDKTYWGPLAGLLDKGVDPALAIELSAPFAGYWTPGLGRMELTSFPVEGGHFAERFQAFIIIALGESIVVTGATAADVGLSATVVVALAIAFLETAALWWLYFGEAAVHSRQLMREVDDPTTLARDAYTYLHLPMVAGIVLFAFAMKTTLAHVSDELATIPALGLCGGPALYLLAYVALRVRVAHTLGRGRLIAAHHGRARPDGSPGSAWPTSGGDGRVGGALTGDLGGGKPGHAVAVQPAASQLLPVIKPLPTGVELQEYWMRELSKGEAAIFKIAVDAYPESVHVSAISESTGYAPRSRDTYISSMMSKEILDRVSPGVIKASADLF
jgi:hypothetical protein